MNNVLSESGFFIALRIERRMQAFAFVSIFWLENGTAEVYLIDSLCWLPEGPSCITQLAS